MCANLAMSERLKILLSGNAWIIPDFGFGHGFNIYLNTLAKEGFKGHSLHKQIGMMIGALKNSCFLLFLHYMDTHQPFNQMDDRKADILKIRANLPTDPRRDPLYHWDFAEEICAYNSSVSTADYFIGNLVDMLKEEGIIVNTIIALFSDHGEELRERNRLRYPRHGHSLYGELLNVPCLLYVPEALKEHTTEQMNRFEGRRFQIHHLIPMLEAVAGHLDFSPEWFSERIISMVGFHGLKISIIEKNLKLILDMKEHTEELYNLSDDPGEFTNIAGSSDDETDGSRWR